MSKELSDVHSIHKCWEDKMSERKEAVCEAPEVTEYYFSIGTAVWVPGTSGTTTITKMLMQECILEGVLVRYFPLESLQENGPRR